MAAATFAASRLDWEEPAREPHASLLSWYRSLIAVRSASRGLEGVDRPEVQAGGDGEWLLVRCGDRSVAINLTATPHSMEVRPGMAIAAASRTTDIDLDGSRLTLPGMTAAVLTETART
jgi:maltooligosyltrehalose trehalohydrolase